MARVTQVAAMMARPRPLPTQRRVSGAAATHLPDTGQQPRSSDRGGMDMKLELVPLPAHDVDASLAFYVDRVGFVLDHDVEPGNGMRIVQLTPPGSACSITVGTGMGLEDAAPVRNLHLVVSDVARARADLAGRGVEVSEVHDMGGVKYAYFADPTGNSWALQEIATRQLP